ncbi:pilin N-terminal domain-containing protein [Lactiplantibacillus plantarum]|uniref:pilin N-terminal domain-containing protein n=1 Tax=Lactiplantibacillus plantarum TaxID=1590 RepID=UPI001BACFD07|nr:pilin N-terminal domain-containing protein [Lactiplantibacillus plantarum]MBS0936359.1 hypothetical protein [Lactiplantibacillus plantarum]MBS0943788.1 hypothetical protein [Lactiplantibacillus plantarum]
MSKRQLAANLMVATFLFSSALPLLNAAAASKSESSSEVVAKVTSNSQAKDSSSAKASSETKKTGDEIQKTSDETSTDKIQTLTSQTMIINKIIAKQGAMAGTESVASLEYKGVNGSTFKVYDVTELMTTILKEELKTDKTVKASDSEVDRVVDQTANEIDLKAESGTASASSQSVASGDSSVVSSSQSKDESTDKASDKDGASSSQATSSTSSATSGSSKSTASANDDGNDAALLAKINDLRKGDKLRELVEKRAEKLSGSQLKSVATVKTAHDDQLKHDGIARVKLPIDGKYHAYYVVNTDTPKETYATNADPIVIFTPVTNEDGLYADDFMIYPKSDSVAKPTTKTMSKTPEKVTTVPMYQTGAKQQSWFGNFLESIWNLF